MCGIFGFVDAANALPPLERLCRLTNLVRHRGPDGGGYWTDRGVFFGHRRLSIIDLAGGQQPMASADGRYVITFNGEIYNYPELRGELTADGVRFRTTSDTEVILEAYARWGLDALAKLEGMFAFGLYDCAERTLLLARDRFGEKPLLYAAEGSRVVFASGMAPLAAAGVAGSEIDLEALGGYLCLNYVPGQATMLRNVRRVAPGEWRLYGREGLRNTGQYWTLRAGTVDVSRLSDEQIVDAQRRARRPLSLGRRRFFRRGAERGTPWPSAERLLCRFHGAGIFGMAARVGCRAGARCAAHARRPRRRRPR